MIYIVSAVLFDRCLKFKLITLEFFLHISHLFYLFISTVYKYFIFWYTLLLVLGMSCHQKWCSRNWRWFPRHLFFLKHFFCSTCNKKRTALLASLINVASRGCSPCQCSLQSCWLDLWLQYTSIQYFRIIDLAKNIERYEVHWIWDF